MEVAEIAKNPNLIEAEEVSETTLSESEVIRNKHPYLYNCL